MQRLDFLINNYLFEIKAGAVMVFGAFIHALIRYKQARDNKEEDFGLIDFFILIPIAIFTGYLFFLIGSIYFTDTSIHFLLAGAGAVSGISGLNELTRLAVNLLGGLAGKGKK